MKKVWDKVSFWSNANLEDQILLTKNLGIMLKSGVSMADALMILEEDLPNKTRKVIGDVKRQVISGQSLSGAIENYPKVFSTLVVKIVKVGEVSGSLDEKLISISERLARDLSLRKKLSNALTYPMIVLFVAIAVMFLTTFVFLPQITHLFDNLDVELPLLTVLLIAFANFVSEYVLALLIGVTVGVVGLLFVLTRSWAKPFTCWVSLNMPIINELTIKNNLSSILGTMSSLLQSGVSVDQTLLITRDTLSNVYYRKIFEETFEKVSKGGKISEVLEKYPKLFPLMSVKILKVGERTGKIQESCEYLSDHYEEDVENYSKYLPSLLEPIILVAVGLLVAFLIFAIIKPIYDVAGYIKF
jgi:type II secretory pathway component PulF